jgi:iron complex outermembrane recepter protein
LRLMVYGGQRQTVQFQAIPVAAQASPLHPGGVIGLDREYAGTDVRWTHRVGHTLEIVGGLSYDRMHEHRLGWQNFTGATVGVEGALRRDEGNEVANLDPYLQAMWKSAAWTVTAGVRRSSIRFSSSDNYIAGANGNDSGSVRYAATLPAFAAMYALSPTLHLYGAVGRGFETPTFNELAYRADGTPGLNFALRPSRSHNVEAGIKGRMNRDAEFNSEWNAAVFETRTQDEIVTQTNSGGRSTFQNAGATRRHGVEFAWSAAFASAWRLQFAQTWLDARYRDAFVTCAAAPCTAPALPIAAGNRIPGIARSFTAAELAWQPDRGWRAGAEVRRSSRVWVNDANTEAAPAFTTAALHAGYVFDVTGWVLAAAARIDNLFDRRYAGSVIVNEGNGRYYEPAPGRTFTLKVTGTYAF